ncbi:MAG TPA: efflux RND transporter periplasmic adaptor subunit [Pirellulaceae bacterium]
MTPSKEPQGRIATLVSRHFAGFATGITVCFLAMSMLGYVTVLRPILRRRAHFRPTEVHKSTGLVVLAADGNSLTVPVEATTVLGIKVEPAKAIELPQSLELTGTLTLDSTRLQEVRSRFAGEVVEIGKTADGSRTLQFGDRVEKEQLMAVVWSRELGEKKSELVDVRSQYHLNSITLERLEKLRHEGVIAERQYRDAERAVETDRINIAKVLHTLQTWRVDEDEISTVEAEAKQIITGKEQPSSQQSERWARVEVRAARSGTILEQNIAIGDIVATSDDLFKVADLSRLRVLAYAYEEDLPRLDTLTTDQRQWIISVPADPQMSPRQGVFEQIGRIIDPTQHTALVMGWVDNENSMLRVGQFITATITLPSPGNEVVVPVSALVEKGSEKYVFVQSDAEATQFTRRQVSYSRHVGGQACFHIEPPPEARASGAKGVRPGERIVVSGAVELLQALTDLLATKREEAAEGVKTPPNA